MILVRKRPGRYIESLESSVWLCRHASHTYALGCVCQNFGFKCQGGCLYSLHMVVVVVVVFNMCAHNCAGCSGPECV